MRRTRAFAYSAFVALAVFAYLALPTLRAMYGPVVNLPVYALVALVAGRLTWAVLADRPSDRTVEPDRSPVEAGADQPEADVDDELATLKDDV